MPTAFDCRRYTSQACQICLALLLTVFLFWVAVRSILTDFLLCALSLRSLFEAKGGLAALLPTTHPIYMRSVCIFCLAGPCRDKSMLHHCLSWTLFPSPTILQRTRFCYSRIKTNFIYKRTCEMSRRAGHITCLAQKNRLTEHDLHGHLFVLHNIIQTCENYRRGVIWSFIYFI